MALLLTARRSLVLLALTAVPIGAQEATGPRTPNAFVDTLPASASPSYMAGWVDGTKAGETPSMGGRFGAGFVGGLLMGMFGVGVGRHAIPTVGTAVGALMVGSALVPGPEDPFAAGVAQRGSDQRYDDAFRQAYMSHVARRAKGAAWGGTLSGAAAGIGLVLVLFAALGD